MINKYVFFTLLVMLPQSIYSSTIYASIMNNLLPPKKQIPSQKHLQPYVTRRTNSLSTTSQESCITAEKQSSSLDEILQEHPLFNPEKEEYDPLTKKIKSRPIRIKRIHESDDENNS